MITIRQTCVHNVIQEGAKTLLSRSRVEVPQLVLDLLAEWRKQTIYAGDNDYVFPSVKLSGKCPRSASMLVEDYIRPAAIRAGILIERGGQDVQQGWMWWIDARFLLRLGVDFVYQYTGI